MYVLNGHGAKEIAWVVVVLPSWCLTSIVSCTRPAMLNPFLPTYRLVHSRYSAILLIIARADVPPSRYSLLLLRRVLRILVYLPLFSVSLATIHLAISNVGVTNQLLNACDLLITDFAVQERGRVGSSDPKEDAIMREWLKSGIASAWKFVHETKAKTLNFVKCTVASHKAWVLWPTVSFVTGRTLLPRITAAERVCGVDFTTPLISLKLSNEVAGFVNSMAGSGFIELNDAHLSI